jgi:hypothetical protein
MPQGVHCNKTYIYQGIIALLTFFLVSISATMVVMALLSRRPIYFTVKVSN